VYIYIRICLTRGEECITILFIYLFIDDTRFQFWFVCYIHRGNTHFKHSQLSPFVWMHPFYTIYKTIKNLHSGNEKREQSISYYVMRSVSQFVSATWYRFQCYKSQRHWYTCSNVSNTRCTWNAYKPKRVSDSKLSTVGEENHLLISDIVKTSVWSGVRYELPAEASSNNDVAHSWLDHVARNAVRTRSCSQPQAAILPPYNIAGLTSPIKTTFVKNISPLRILLRRWQ